MLFIGFHNYTMLLCLICLPQLQHNSQQVALLLKLNVGQISVDLFKHSGWMIEHSGVAVFGKAV